VGIGSQSIGGMGVDQAPQLLQGPPGSLVTLAVLRAPAPARAVTVRREHVEVPSVEDARIVDPAAGIAYLKISSFQKTTATDLEASLRRLDVAGMRSLIIDLRGNPGGLLQSAVSFVNAFVRTGRIVSVEDRNGQEQYAFTAQRQRAPLAEVPTVVLINEGSASASEIVSGALEAHDAAVVIGERSFGKGSVQEVTPLRDRSREAAVKVTTQHYVLPPEEGKAKGRQVHKSPGSEDWGVVPDLRVKMTPDQLEKLSELRAAVAPLPTADKAPEGPRQDPDEILATGTDPQLETALLALRARLVRDMPATAVAEAPQAEKPATQTP